MKYLILMFQLFLLCSNAVKVKAFIMPSSTHPYTFTMVRRIGTARVDTATNSDKEAVTAVETEAVVATEISIDESRPFMDVESGMMPTETMLSSRNSSKRFPISPAELENQKFDCDPSVEFWRNFQIGGLESAQENIQNIIRIATTFAQTPEGFDYWVRHTGRTMYFLSNALLGIGSFRLRELLVKGDAEGGAFDSLVSDPSVATRMLLECANCYQQDFQRIQEEKYNRPYDMYQPTRQSSPFYYGRQTARFIQESIATLSRRKRSGENDKKIWISDEASSSASLYPEYYRTAFHYQTDGWMSQKSANVYETSTETLFLGRQDAMQRTALPPLVSLSKKLQNEGTKKMKVLEIACGTGRFMTFARDSLPSETEFTASDLSPFYLDAARDNDNHWRRIRKQVDGVPSRPISPARFVQAKAEELPFDNEQYDAVVCIYLFHELPRTIRAKVAQEMARVVKPGGKIILTDSVQLGDRPIFDASLGNFGNMNEPYYNDYIEDNLPLHFEKAGLDCETKMVCASTKTLSFGKR